MLIDEIIGWNERCYQLLPSVANHPCIGHYREYHTPANIIPIKMFSHKNMQTYLEGMMTKHIDTI